MPFAEVVEALVVATSAVEKSPQRFQHAENGPNERRQRSRVALHGDLFKTKHVRPHVFAHHDTADFPTPRGCQRLNQLVLNFRRYE